MKRFIGSLAVVCLLAGCLSVRQDQVVTIKSLEQRKAVTITDQGLSSSKQDALLQYRNFLATTPASPLRAEALRRVADLQLELGDEEQPAQARTKDEAEDYRAAIRLYRDLLKDYPAAPDNDRVLYQLARAYESSGQPEQALAVLDQLVSRYPQTSYLDEAQFRRAEMLFVRQNYALAGKAYGQVLIIGQHSPFFEQALYKQGWSLFKQARYQQALKDFSRILDRKLGTTAPVHLDALKHADHEMVNDTLRVASLSFSYLSGPQSIDAYLDASGRRAYAYLFYASLGDLYLSKERYSDAARSFQAFAERTPLHIQAPLFAIRAIEAYQRGAFPSRVVQGKLAFVQRYGLDGEFWRHHKQDEVPRAVQYLQASLVELAQHFHARAQHTAKSEDYRQAIHWYRRFLDYFPAAANAPGLNYQLAEALYESGRYHEAALQYEHTAYDYPIHGRAAEAGYAALQAYKKATPKLSGAHQQQWRRQALGSALRFADRFPDHAQAAAVLAKTAEAYFALNEAEAAAVVAARVLQRQPPAASQLRRSAWLVQGHTAFDRGAYAEAEQAYQQVLSMMPRKDRQYQPIVERLAAAIYKQGAQRRSGGDLEGAVADFLRVGQLTPGAAIRPTAEYDAAAALIALQHWPQAIRVLERFRRAFPGHPLQKEIPAKLSVAYLQHGRPLKAAQEFARIGGLSDSPAVRREALWRAAQLYEQGGKTGAAAAAYKHYLKAFPRPFGQAMEAREQLAKLNLKVGNKRRHRYWLKEIIKADKKAGKVRSARSRYLAAKASLVLAQPYYQAFIKVRLVVPLKHSLHRKKQRMKRALKAYQQAANYGIAEITTAATFRIAEIYHGLSRALLKSQRPKKLSAEEREQYDILLEEQAYPFEEQAISIHEVNTQRAGDGIYDQWVKSSFKQLADLLPVRYAKTERGEALVEAMP